MEKSIADASEAGPSQASSSEAIYGKLSSRRIRKCEAANCDSEDHLFTFPKNPALARKWDQFVKTKVSKTHALLCFFLV